MAGFYSARSSIMPPLPWPTFAPPLSFDHAYTVVMYVAAGVLAVGALITGILLRRYGPGSQSSAYPTQH